MTPKETNRGGYLLAVDSASKKLGGKWLLNNISFQVRKEEVLFLRGDNGSGKTTLLRLLAGIYSPDRGSIGFIESGLSPRLSPGRVSLAEVRSYFYLNLTIEENLRVYQGLAGWSESELVGLIKQFSLEPFLNKLLRECSAGTVKRAALVRAFAGSADLVLLDEPLTFLDEFGRDALLERVKELVTLGRSLVIASNQIENLKLDNVNSLLLKSGRLAEGGSNGFD